MAAEQIQLRASDADRDQVADLLTAAFSEGRLTHEEFDLRVNSAMQARHFDELVELTRDLVPLDDLRPRQLPEGPPLPTDEPELLTAFLSGAKRDGDWRPRARTRVRAFWGGVELDLTEAVWPGNRVELDIQLCMAGVEIKVGSDVRVTDRMTAIMGGNDIKRVAGAGAARELVLTGTVMMGGVEVRGPKQKKHKTK